MSVELLCYLIAVILAAVSAFVNPSRVSLLALAVAFLAAGHVASVAS